MSRCFVLRGADDGDDVASHSLSSVTSFAWAIYLENRRLVVVNRSYVYNARRTRVEWNGWMDGESAESLTMIVYCVIAVWHGALGDFGETLFLLHASV